MNKVELKQAMISIICGALTIFLVTLLEGLLEFIKTYGAEIVGSGVAAWRYALKARIG